MTCFSHLFLVILVVFACFCMVGGTKKKSPSRRWRANSAASPPGNRAPAQDPRNPRGPNPLLVVLRVGRGWGRARLVCLGGAFKRMFKCFGGDKGDSSWRCGYKKIQEASPNLQTSAAGPANLKPSACLLLGLPLEKRLKPQVDLVPRAPPTLWRIHQICQGLPRRAHASGGEVSVKQQLSCFFEVFVYRYHQFVIDLINIKIINCNIWVCANIHGKCLHFTCCNVPNLNKQQFASAWYKPHHHPAKNSSLFQCFQFLGSLSFLASRTARFRIFPLPAGRLKSAPAISKDFQDIH